MQLKKKWADQDVYINNVLHTSFNIKDQGPFILVSET